MGSNTFGVHFRITTWGESHGKAIGVVIDGCPAGLKVSEEDINHALALRAPGRNAWTSPRKEADRGEILSGVYEGITTGAPISIVIYNHDMDSSAYEPIKDLLRPGHANYTYLEKYGVFDYRGGGRASARETACRVAAGAIAKKLLHHYGIFSMAYIKQIGAIEAKIFLDNLPNVLASTLNSPVFCPDLSATEQMLRLIGNAKEAGESLGGIVEFIVASLPAGLGDPVYEKLEARLATAMMSIPATKGFEIGAGFKAVDMKGSEHNDGFISEEGKVKTSTNHAGGTLGGISSGMPIIGRVVLKPTSSIMKPQVTVNTSGEKADFVLPARSRHDPCVAIRAVPVVDAMACLVIVDALLMNRSSKLW